MALSDAPGDDTALADSGMMAAGRAPGPNPIGPQAAIRSVRGRSRCTPTSKTVAAGPTSHPMR